MSDARSADRDLPLQAFIVAPQSGDEPKADKGLSASIARNFGSHVLPLWAFVPIMLQDMLLISSKPKWSIDEIGLFWNAGFGTRRPVVASANRGVRS
jgi:hypothetical protein